MADIYLSNSDKKQKDKEDGGHITNLHSELSHFKKKYEVAEQDISKLQVQIKKLETQIKKQDEEIQSNIKVKLLI